MVITSSLRPSFRQVINHYKTFNIPPHGIFISSPNVDPQTVGGSRSNVTFKDEAKREQTKQNKLEVDGARRGGSRSGRRAERRNK